MAAVTVSLTRSIALARLGRVVREVAAALASGRWVPPVHQVPFAARKCTLLPDVIAAVAVKLTQSMHWQDFFVSYGAWQRPWQVP